ncbi:MAG: hypothetical protein RL311_467 [Bacteroidota bacterium]|jgi:hypothetical protein
MLIHFTIENGFDFQSNQVSKLLETKRPKNCLIFVGYEKVT